MLAVSRVPKRVPWRPHAPDRSVRAVRGSAALLVLGALVLGFVVQVRAWSFLCDDAYISFRYAENLAAHGALVFNPGERVEGYTNFGWVLLLGLGALLGVEPPGLAQVLTVASAAAVVVLAARLGRALAKRADPSPRSSRWSATDLVTPALLVAVPEVMVWSGGGLETAFAAALALGSMLAWVRGRPVVGAALAAATGLTRPDGLLVVGSFVLVDALISVVEHRRLPIAVKSAWLAAATLVVPLAAHLLWRHAYYGAWLPNTWAIKAHGALLRDSWGVPYVRAWADALHLAVASPLLLLVRVRHLPVVVAALAVVGYAYWIGGDFMAYGRFLLPATALVAVVVGWLLRDSGRLVSRWGPFAVGPAVVVALGISTAGALAAQTHRRWSRDMAKPQGWLDGRFEGVAAMDRFARVRVEAGRWMRAHLPPETLVSVGAAGALPYAAGVRVFDVYGLVDPEIAHLDIRPRSGTRGRPGHQIIAPLSYVEGRDPDLACHVGYVGPNPPRRVRGPWGRGHTWACVPVPPIDDRRLDPPRFEPVQYCCRRPLDRTVGPFGASVGEPGQPGQTGKAVP